MRLAQGRHVRFELSEVTPVQVDGEPWVQVQLVTAFLDLMSVCMLTVGTWRDRDQPPRGCQDARQGKSLY